MKRLVILLLCVAIEMLPSKVGAEERTIVALPAVTVFADLFRLDCILKDGVITHMEARDVTRGSKPFKIGLRDGDTLETLFGQRVAGMKKQDFEALLARPPGPESPKSFRFVRKRGFFRRGAIIELTFSVSTGEAKKPNKAPEPTTTSVTSPAAQEPRQP